MPVISRGHLQLLRRPNEALVLDALLQNGDATQFELAEATGLSRPTVSSLVGTIEGLLKRATHIASGRGSGGRPPERLSLRGDLGYLLGVEFAQSIVRVALIDLSGDEPSILRHDLHADASPDESLEVAVTSIRELLGRHRIAQETIVGLGCAVSAPVNSADGVVRSHVLTSPWDGLNLRDEFEQRLRWGRPVVVDNDANLAVMAEQADGAAVGSRDVLYLLWSAGVGGGVTVGGEVLRGTGGVAGELGHLHVPGSITTRPVLCSRCGRNDCLEALAGERAVLATLGSRTKKRSMMEVIDAAQRGDQACRRAIETAAEYVGRVLGLLSLVLNPEIVVVGGAFSNGAYELIAPGLRRGLRDWDAGPASKDMRFLTSIHGDTGPVRGALGIVREQHAARYLLDLVEDSRRVAASGA
jgi:predicted NBD/HSP70 family sugar kinase